MKLPDFRGAWEGLIILMLLSGCGEVPEVENRRLATEVAATVFADETLQPGQGEESFPGRGITPLPTATLHPRAIAPHNVDQLLPLKEYGKGVPLTAAFSPGDDLLAIGTYLGGYLYALPGMEPTAFYPTSDPLSSLAFSRDGKLLAGGSSSGLAWLWRVEDGNLLQTFTYLPGEEEFKQISLSPDSSILAALSYGEILLWRTGDGGLLRTIPYNWGVESIQFSEDGASIYGVGEISLNWETALVVRWRTADGSVMDQLESEMLTNQVSSFALSPRGDKAALGLESGHIQIRSAETGSTLLVLEGHTDEVTNLAFSGDGQMLISTSWDGTVKIWGVEEGIVLQDLESHGDSIFVGFSSAGDQVVYLTGTNAQLLETLSGSVLQSIDFFGGISRAALSPDGRHLAVIGGGKGILYPNFNEEAVLTLEEPSPGWFDDLAFSADGKYLLGTYSRQKGAPQIILGTWNPENGAFSGVVEGVEFYRRVMVSRDGRFLAAAQSDSAAVWSAGEMTLLARPGFSCLNDTQCFESDFVFSPSGNLFAWVLDNGTVSVWETNQWQKVAEYNFTCGTDYCKPGIALSPDESMIAVSLGHDLFLWDLSRGSPEQVLQLDTTLSCMAISPDGVLLAVGGYRTIWLLRLNDGALLRIFDTHRDDVETLLFTPDGSILISGSYDGTLIFWGLPDQYSE